MRLLALLKIGGQISMKRLFTVFLFFSLTACANPPSNPPDPTLDGSDAGIYGVLHRDGHLIDKKLRLVRGAERWQLENLRTDGSWEDVTCEKNCQLVESTNADIQRFMNSEMRPGMRARCIHNIAFAFCRVTEQDSEERRYMLIGLITVQPIPVKLERLK